jgi:lipopolysaccharide export system ATP-binding protein
VLITDHNVERTLEVCDRALIINDGLKLAEGVPKDIINNPRVREAYLGKTFAGDEFD